jgi:hypothetical protein
VSLPATFTWRARGIHGDDYNWILHDPSAPFVLTQSGSLGASAQYTLQSAPDDLGYGKQYLWYLEVLNGDNGFGLSLFHRVSFFGSGSEVGAFVKQ